MSINPLNDISRVYLEQVAAVEEGMTMKDFKQQRSRQKQKEKRAADKIAPNRRKDIHTDRLSPERAARHRANVDPDFEGNDERNYPGGKLNPKKVRKAKALGELGESAVPGKPAERLGAVTAIPKAERDAARERILAKAKAMRKKKGIKEAAKPDYLDFDKDGNEQESMKKALKDKKKKVEEANDGNLANNYPPYDKVTRGDVIAGALGKDQMGGKKKKVTKEEYSNWRQDLSEVISEVGKDKKEDKITEKKVSNTIKINPDIKEAVENLGGTLLEMVEVDEIDYVVESVYDELIEEGYDEDDIEEALEFALTEAKVTFGHDTPTGQKKKGNLVAAVGRLARQKLSSKVRGAKKAAKQAVATGARKVAKGALGVARKMEGGGAKPSAAHTKTRTASTYRGAGAGQKERVSSGSYKAPSTTKKKAEKPADPWEGSATTPPKAKKKKTAAPKAKTPAATPKRKRKSKLDDLLASVRSENTHFGEQSFDINAAGHRQQQRIEKATKLQQATKGAESSAAGSAVKRLGGSGISLPLANSYELAGKNLEELSLPGTGRVMAPKGMSLGFQNKFLGMNVGPRQELPLSKTYSQSSVDRYNRSASAPSTLEKMGSGPLANRHISIPKSKPTVASTTPAKPVAPKPQTASAAMAKAFKGTPLSGAANIANKYDERSNYRNQPPELRRMMGLQNSYELEGNQIDEKTLSSKETKEKERIVKSMKSKAADFEKRYPGRGKEVMYATATKLAKKISK